MREIKFRGKRIKNGEWVYGDLLQGLYGDVYIVITHENGVTKYEVQNETVSQFTGLKDKNGKKIYEGDIVSYVIVTGGIEELQIPANVRHEVTFDENHAVYKIGYHYACTGTMSEVVEAKNIIVMGNRWDNLELLKG